MDQEFPSLRDAEPEGWLELRKQIQNAKDSAQLDAIVRQMHALLREHERKHARANQRECATFDHRGDANQEEIRRSE